MDQLRVQMVMVLLPLHVVAVVVVSILLEELIRIMVSLVVMVSAKVVQVELNLLIPDIKAEVLVEVPVLIMLDHVI